MNSISSSICFYLDGEPGAADILNDALELIGAERTAVDGKTAERLELFLTKLIPREQAERLACDFAEHVLPIAVKQSQQPKLAKKALQAKRKLLDGKIDFRTLKESANKTLSGWQADNSPTSAAIWSIWSAAFGAPKDTAASAQKVSESEIDWQLERAKQFVLEKA